ncbi:hypothetical protein NDI43_04955 [Microcoleus vaginatus GB2-A3]
MNAEPGMYISRSNACNLLVCRYALPSSSVLVRSTDFTSSYRLAIGNKLGLLPIALKEKDLSI